MRLVTAQKTTTLKLQVYWAKVPAQFAELTVTVKICVPQSVGATINEASTKIVE